MPPKRSDAGPSNARCRRKLKEVLAAGDIGSSSDKYGFLALATAGGKTPTTSTALPLPASASGAPAFRYFPPFGTPYRTDLGHNMSTSTDHMMMQYSNNPLLENLTLSPPPAPKISFTSLLTAGLDDDQDAIPPVVREHNAQIDLLITNQGDHLKRVLEEMQRRQYKLVVQEAEEKAAKKVKDKESELNQVSRKIVGYEHREGLLKKENQLLWGKLKYLENANASLRAALQEALQNGGRVEEISEIHQEDAESVHVDPDRAVQVQPVNLACKACEKRVATMMLWPCRHVSTCPSCDETTKACPVCGSLKTTSVEVCLP